MSESVPNQAAPTDQYVVVARRYRPKSFDELVGQEHVGQALKNAIETHRVGHAYLFTGARGVGKTSVARIFAKALNAPEGPTIHPDNDSDVCRAIDAGEDLDVLEIDGASNNGVDQIRTLRANAGVRPSRSRHKIYIIDEVHMLSMGAFNALLKTLEEPPEHVKFIFCTTDPEKVPITVRSRCQRFDFAPVHTDAIMQRLREIVDHENVPADDDALRLIARRATGSMRDSQSLLEQVLSFTTERLTVTAVHSMLGTAGDERVAKLTQFLLQRDAQGALQEVDTAIAEGVDAGQLGEQLLGYFRDALVATIGCSPDLLRHCSETMYQELKERGSQWGIATMLAVVSLIDQTITRMRQNVHSRVLLEVAMIQICQLPDMQRLADAVAGAKSMLAGSIPEKKNVSPSPKPKASQLAENLDRRDSSPPTAPPTPKTLKSGNASPTAPQPSPATKGDHWTASGVRQLWQQAVATLDDLTADLARQSCRIESLEPGKIRVFFPANYQLAKTRCDKPEQKSKIEGALSQIVARRVLVETAFDSQAVVQQPNVPRESSADRKQKQRELQSHPLVRKCIEVFGAEVVRVDPPPQPG